PVERDPGVERRREEIRQRDDQRVRVTLFPLHVEEAFRAGAARLIDHYQWPRRELLLVGDASDEARHLIGAAPGAARNDEPDRLGGLPRGECRRGRRTEQEQSSERCHEPSPMTSHVSLSFRVEWVRPSKQTRAKPCSAGLGPMSRANAYFPCLSFQNG